MPAPTGTSDCATSSPADVIKFMVLSTPFETSATAEVTAPSVDVTAFSDSETADAIAPSAARPVDSTDLETSSVTSLANLETLVVAVLHCFCASSNTGTDTSSTSNNGDADDSTVTAEPRSFIARASFTVETSTESRAESSRASISSTSVVDCIMAGSTLGTEMADTGGVTTAGTGTLIKSSTASTTSDSSTTPDSAPGAVGVGVSMGGMVSAGRRTTGSTEADSVVVKERAMSSASFSSEDEGIAGTAERSGTAASRISSAGTMVTMGKEAASMKRGDSRPSAADGRSKGTTTSVSAKVSTDGSSEGTSANSAESSSADGSSELEGTTSESAKTASDGTDETAVTSAMEGSSDTDDRLAPAPEPVAVVTGAKSNSVDTVRSAICASEVEDDMGPSVSTGSAVSMASLTGREDCSPFSNQLTGMVMT
mmetsp:Transcript_5319/g.8228  ORF Transcript_5319/g.8228 Transcript_5319/m.8228 type:complete len:427 (+) Transcript_5319:1491-2771(+)